jgi:VIT1/CCC1 family predicted Fe2+/Mn2+ transporter
MTATDALRAHSRDELGISDMHAARPVQAALASAASFAVGAALPLVTILVVPEDLIAPLVAGASLLFLAVLGGVAARAGGAGVVRGSVRVTVWGALAMGITALVGKAVGMTV